jgi:hypothetical protein
MTTKRSIPKQLEDITVEPYRVDTPVTNADYAKPFKQIEKLLRDIHSSGDNTRR